MTRRRTVTALVIGVAAFAAVLLAWQMNRPAAVALLTVKAEPTERVLSVVGRVRPVALVQVNPVAPGQVVRLLHDEGDRVAAGAPLAVIKSTVEAAQADAERARIAAAEARAVEAAQALSRTKTLFDKGFAAQAALDQARAAKRSADAEVAAAQATYRAATERSREAVVTAPMAGVVLSRPIDNGQVVTASTVLFELGGVDGFEVEAEVDEIYADAVRPGMTARLAPAGSDAVNPARVSEVSPKVDATTGGRLVRLVGDQVAGLAPGRSVDATIVVSPAAPRIVVPRQALVDATVAPKVYVVGADDVVRAQPVRIDPWPSIDAIVLGGLKGGERILADPAQAKPGARVRPAAP